MTEHKQSLQTRDTGNWLFRSLGWDITRSNTDGQGNPYKLRTRLRWSRLTPMTFFGGRVVAYCWGWNIRTRRGHWVVSRSGGGPTRIYRSPNGTPSKADKWIKGRPAR